MIDSLPPDLTEHIAATARMLRSEAWTLEKCLDWASTVSLVIEVKHGYNADSAQRQVEPIIRGVFEES